MERLANGVFWIDEAEISPLLDFIDGDSLVIMQLDVSGVEQFFSHEKFRSESEKFTLDKENELSLRKENLGCSVAGTEDSIRSKILSQFT